MDDFRNTTERLSIVVDGNTKLDVVYTNEPHKMEEILTLYEEWLREDRYKFVGLDLEYTREDYFDHSRKVAIMQLAMRKHVLVYHLCKARMECATLKDFLWNKGIISLVSTSGTIEMFSQKGSSKSQESVTSTFKRSS